MVCVERGAGRPSQQGDLSWEIVKPAQLAISIFIPIYDSYRTDEEKDAFINNTNDKRSSQKKKLKLHKMRYDTL